MTDTTIMTDKKSKIEVTNADEFKKAFKYPKEYEYRMPKWRIEQSFETAKKILDSFDGGKFFVTNNPYELYLFEIKGKVRIIFYPHKTSASNINVRPRNQSSKDMNLFKKIKSTLENNDIHMFWFKINCK